MKTKVWSVLFETHSGAVHPIRFKYDEPQLKSKARTDAQIYLMQNQWLKRIEDVYAPDSTATPPEPSSNQTDK